ncbi:MULTISPECIES: DUF1616 domain-containing protein [Actinoplanes]|uniref:DUF1616 domain-containing protein n=1 Tax=Actinoplanes TaxID=1865 RepID=UPI0005F28825|nr:MULTISPECIES: DUF1616 domain-containing protein [Actinoplanes]GLY06351.1 hypothetical protein Acsp01_67300 [Actinoplanes sp. NBRC 101535]
MNTARAGVLAGLTVVAGAAVMFGPLPLSVPGGLALALVLPGLALVEAIFRPGRRDIGIVERLVLIPSLSLALMVLGGLAVWAVGGTLNRIAWMLIAAAATLMGLSLALFRAKTLQPGPVRISTAEPDRSPFWTKKRILSDILPLALAVVLISGIGWWSFLDSEQTYDSKLTTLAVSPPPSTGADGNRTVEITATGLDVTAGPWTLVLIGTAGEKLATNVLTPDDDGVWDGPFTLPGEDRVTANLYRGTDMTSPFRTVIIAAAAAQ